MQRKRIWLKDKLILGLALIDFAMREFRDPGGFVSFSYENMYGFTPQGYKKQNFNMLVSRLSKNKKMSKIVKDGKVCFIISDCKGILIEKFPLLGLREKWDGMFQVAIFDIEEVNRVRRNFLRRKLKELGFGMWQRSVWVSPLSIKNKFREFLKEQEFSEMVYIFSVKKEDFGDLKSFANGVWKLEEINKQYKGWMERLEATKGKSLQDNLKNEFLDIVLRDPFLPKEFLPQDWLGEQALKLFRQETMI
ncbi:MAG: PaaX family transcriptional regulator C-terminal domain-containing protein [Candidatus Levybacteria bacterium]|nr:PaaX family transcriptional regulator C-terminal domain-containing protein [Candidatus Levybacteria bacterium]